MAIQKKSLISNRRATKKALVAKPEATTVAPTRFKVHPPTRLRAIDATRMKVTRLRGAL